MSKIIYNHYKTYSIVLINNINIHIILYDEFNISYSYIYNNDDKDNMIKHQKLILKLINDSGYILTKINSDSYQIIFEHEFIVLKFILAKCENCDHQKNIDLLLKDRILKFHLLSLQNIEYSDPYHTYEDIEKITQMFEAICTSLHDALLIQYISYKINNLNKITNYFDKIISELNDLNFNNLPLIFAFPTEFTEIVNKILQHSKTNHNIYLFLINIDIFNTIIKLAHTSKNHKYEVLKLLTIGQATPIIEKFDILLNNEISELRHYIQRFHYDATDDDVNLMIQDVLQFVNLKFDIKYPLINNKNNILTSNILNKTNSIKHKIPYIYSLHYSVNKSEYYNDKYNYEFTYKYDKIYPKISNESFLENDSLVNWNDYNDNVCLNDSITDDNTEINHGLTCYGNNTTIEMKLVKNDIKNYYPLKIIIEDIIILLHDHQKYNCVRFSNYVSDIIHTADIEPKSIELKYIYDSPNLLNCMIEINFTDVKHNNKITFKNFKKLNIDFASLITSQIKEIHLINTILFNSSKENDLLMKNNNIICYNLSKLE